MKKKITLVLGLAAALAAPLLAFAGNGSGGCCLPGCPFC